MEKEDLIDFCIIASKTFNLDAICQQYYDILSQFTGFILLQNGIGNEDIIRNYFVDKKIIRIITSNGAILEENIINHTGEGETYFCDLNQIENGELNSEQPRFNTIQLIFEYCQKAG